MRAASPAPLVRRPASTLALAALAATLAAPAAAAQTFDDGLTVPRRQLRTTVEVGREWWDSYWEGELKRTNENIGTLTSESVTLTAAYGVTGRLSLIAALPYVRNEASRGVLHSQRGMQDLVGGAKLRLFEARVGRRMSLGATALAAVGVPTTDYTVDFLPMSIGLGSRRATARGVLHLKDRGGLFAEGSAAHSWRSTVRLDRPAYYTDGRLTLSDEVAMPDVFDYAATAGYQKGRLCLPVSLMGQRTLGGGDIRRQDMPFVSNRMNFTRLQAQMMYTLPRVPGLIVNLGAMRTLSGRNVGQSTRLSGGLTSTIRL